MSEEKCYFTEIFQCQSKSDPLITSGVQRINTIIEYSKEYSDGIYLELEQLLADDPNSTIKCHKTCVNHYATSHHRNRILKRKSNSDSLPDVSTKQTRLSIGTKFDFLRDCIFCSEQCDIVKDPKNPNRWRAAYLTKLCDKNENNNSLKNTITKACDIREDSWAAKVKLNIAGAASDLHAVGGRYHNDCRTKFMSPLSLSVVKGKGKYADDRAFTSLCKLLTSDKLKIWNAVELYRVYLSYDGCLLTRTQLLIEKLKKYYGDDLLVLSSPGISNIVLFRGKASSLFNVTDEDTGDLDAALSTVSKQVKHEVKEIILDKTNYSIEIDRDSTLETISDTVMNFLAMLSPKLDKTLPAILIGSMITTALHCHPTSLQIALGVLIRESKQLINRMYSFGVTCSYMEVLRFKKSAAFYAAQNDNKIGISDCNSGLVQVVVDNFDADISSQNGKLSTHSLAMLVTQTQSNPEIMQSSIKRITQSKINKKIEYEPVIHKYIGPKDPVLPVEASKKRVPFLKMLASQSISLKRAKHLDTLFLRDILLTDNCSELNGYNTSMCREQGHTLSPKMVAVYLPLIDMTPSDPDTMMTSMIQAQKLSENTGQKYVVFTCDLQLYKVALHIIWAHPERFRNIILRLGGMHALMSFIGCIGTLMAESGLSDILEGTFAGVPKMLLGKKFPQNVRALRLVAEELLRKVMIYNDINCVEDLQSVLENLAMRSKTSKLWVDGLIKPVFIMMRFIRAEREGDWPLHIATFKEMLPYYFAAGHIHYARYGQY